MASTLIGGAETRVNTTTAYDQKSPAIAVLNDGSYVVAWSSDNSAGQGTIYTQHYSAAGAKIGGETRINTPATGADAMYPSVSALSTGGYVVAWNVVSSVGTMYSTHAKMYNASDVATSGDIIISQNATYDQGFAKVAQWDKAGAGGFVTIWESNNAPPPTANFHGIHGQLVNPNGTLVPGDFRVNLTLVGEQLDPSLARFQNGSGFVVAFETPDASGSGIVMRLYDGAAVGAATEIRVNNYTTGDQLDPAVAALNGGGIVVTYSSAGQDGSGAGVYAQTFTAAGAKVGGEVLVNTTTQGDQGHPQITELADGGYVIVWESTAQDGSGKGLYYQRFDAAGARLGGETLVNSTTLSDQDEVDVTALGQGFIVTWTSAGQDGSGEGVYQRTFAVPTSTNPTTPVPVNTLPKITGGLAGAVTEDGVLTASGQLSANDPGDTATWSVTGGASPYGALSIDATGKWTFTLNNTAAQSLTAADHIAAAYTVQVTDGHGATASTALNVTINGADEPVVTPPPVITPTTPPTQVGRSFGGGSGADLLVGGDGFDTIFGLGGADTLRGGLGDDSLDGGAGLDSLAGGGGNDSYVIDSASDIVSELAGEGIDSVYSAVSYVLPANVENLILRYVNRSSGVGNTLDNKINGNGGDNGLWGLAGDDSLSGSGGADTLNGGRGDDMLTGGDGADSFVMIKGDGHDTISDFGVGGKDSLDLSAFFSAKLRPAITDNGTDTLLSFSSGESVLLLGVHASELVATTTGYVHV